MTKEYREELAAAHARIAQLEAQLADKDASTDPKIEKLEEQRVRIVRTSAPAYVRRVALGVVGAFTLLFTVIGIIAWASVGASPSEAGMVGGIGGLGLGIGLLVGVLQLFIAPVTARQQLERIDQQLAETRRIAKLESDVAEMRRVRVGAEPAIEAEDDDERESSETIARN